MKILIFFFSKGITDESKISIIGTLEKQEGESKGKYLGLPFMTGRSKDIFQFVHDRIWKKLSGWKEKSLSQREVLIKSVVQSIPTYLMACFLLPNSMCSSITGLVRHFWWGGDDHHK